MTAEKSSYKVVVTGFGPFQNVPVNESWRAVSGLWNEEIPAQIKLVTRELPVVYDIVRTEIENIWKTEQPDLIIHVGVSKGDNQISLEKQSFNLGYNHQDIQDKCPANECCVENGAEILQTKLDVDRLCKVSNSRLESCNSEGKCGDSTDPGRFLCGFIYYQSLHRDANKALFVHVPDESIISIEHMTQALRAIIIDSLNQLYNANLQL